jgi:hypothetical protein
LVFFAVAVDVSVAVDVNVGVNVDVDVDVEVDVDVDVGVDVSVNVGVNVGVDVDVNVGVNVGVVVGVAVGRAQTTGAISLLINVTAPSADWPSAKSLPATFAALVSEMLSAAITVPTNVEGEPKVAELPTFQNTLQPGVPTPPLLKTTDELDAVTSVLPVLNIQTALGSPWALRVSVPVKLADDEKQ